MAIKYNTPKSVLPADWSYEKDSHYYEYWVDFKEKALQGQWAKVLNGKFNARFGEFTKDWTVDDYRNWAESSGLTESIKKGLPSDYSLWTNLLASDDIGGIQRVIGALVMDKNGHFTDAKYETSASDIASVVDGMRSYNAQNELVSNLKEKGGTDEQIQAILDSRDGTTEGYTALSDDIADLSGDAWNSYIADNFAKNNVLPDNTWGSGDTAYTIDNATLAGANPVTPTDQAQETLDESTFGDPTNPDGLTPVKDANGNVVDGEFTDANGKTFFLTDNGEYRDADGNPYISPGQSTVATEIQDDQESANAAEDVVDTAVQQSAEGAQGASDINIAYTGGAVNEGVANALGWNRNVLDDGTVQYTDPQTNSVYTLGDEGALTNTTSGEEAYTEGMLNFEENDFAGAFQDTVNEYLFGSSINRSNFADYGFTFDETTGKYTGPNGQTYGVDTSGTLVDVSGNVLRNQGFLEYQQDLEAAGEQYTTDMTALRKEYANAYSDYESELRPRMGQLDSNIGALNQVAQNANDTNYYNRLKNLYFAEAQDQIDRSARGSQETLNATYANAGLDPSSPAYTAAIMDLEKKRADATRSANRQAMLDSYTMGSNMLGNRQNALNSAQAGITTGMNALGNLYGVKISGLDVDKDMISTIYSGKQNQAAVGISGLNTLAQQQQSGINAERDQFNTNLNLRTGLNAGTIDAANAAATTAGNADANATNDYWTGMGWLQTLIDNKFDWGATGAALQTQFPDFDFSTLDPKLLEQLQITP